MVIGQLLCSKTMHFSEFEIEEISHCKAADQCLVSFLVAFHTATDNVAYMCSIMQHNATQCTYYAGETIDVGCMIMHTVQHRANVCAHMCICAQICTVLHCVHNHAHCI